MRSRTRERLNKFGFLIGFLGAGCLLGVFLTAAPGCSDGIYAAPSGEAAYIQGSNCTINMEPDDNGVFDYARMQQDFEYCQVAHICHYGELKVAFPSGEDCVETLNLYLKTNQERPPCSDSDASWCL